MNVVLDTNVVVSGLLNPYGQCASILRLVLVKSIVPALDARIISEYDQVLRRPKFQFQEYLVDDFMESLKEAGVLITPSPLKSGLPDSSDLPFLEVAVASKADYLITGNTKHFPARLSKGVNVVTPAQFMEIFRKT